MRVIAWFCVFFVSFYIILKFLNILKILKTFKNITHIKNTHKNDIYFLIV